MPNLNKLITEQKNIAIAVEHAGFVAPLFFKGFSPKEEHCLCIAIKDRYTLLDEPRPSLLRRVDLKKKLTEIMGCKIILDDYKQIQPALLEKLLTGRCAKLLINASDEEAKVSVVSVKDRSVIFESEATSHFGKGWTFTPESVEKLFKITPSLDAKATRSFPPPFSPRLPEFERVKSRPDIRRKKPVEAVEEKGFDAEVQQIAEKLKRWGVADKAGIDRVMSTLIKSVENKLSEWNSHNKPHF